MKIKNISLEENNTEEERVICPIWIIMDRERQRKDDQRVMQTDTKRVKERDGEQCVGMS